MATDTRKTSPTPAFVRPEGLANLNAKYPQYNPGPDGRDMKNFGKLGAPIHGLLLGKIELPATISNDDGELRPWLAYVIELKQPCPVKYTDAEGQEQTKIAVKGERIILTATTAIESNEAFNKIANSAKIIGEVFIEPKVGRTKAGRALWTYPTLAVGNFTERLPTHNVSAAMFEVMANLSLAAGESANQLTTGGAPASA